MKLCKAIAVSIVLVSMLVLLVPTAIGAPPVNKERKVPVTKIESLVEVPAATTAATVEVLVATDDAPVEKVTGGGWILDTCLDDDKKTFGFNAMRDRDCLLKGKLEYVDHGTKMTVHSDIDSLMINGNEAMFGGNCRVNGEDGYTLWVHVVDWGEPGRDDYFGISVRGPDDFFYWASGTLGANPGGGGGNIQIH